MDKEHNSDDAILDEVELNDAGLEDVGSVDAGLDDTIIKVMNAILTWKV